MQDDLGPPPNPKSDADGPRTADKDEDTAGFLARMTLASSERLLNADMNDEQQRRVLLATLSQRLFYALAVALSLAFLIIFFLLWFDSPINIVVPIVMLCGVVGGFVGIQRHLNDLKIEDLKLLTDSFSYLILSPMVGGVLAIVLYVLFLSGLLKGDLFPTFEKATTAEGGSVRGFLSVFNQYATDYEDYAKLMFWSFVAGFSERFVTDVIGKFEGKAGNAGK